jgi:hypothetical protein
MTLPRVFFDANTGSMEDGYWLGFDKSRKDLEVLGDKLREGTRVIIYMPDEFEMDATLRFDAVEAVWCAEPVADSIRYLDGSI